MSVDPPPACSFCQQPVEGRELNYRFLLPDPILEIPEAERPHRVRDSGDVVGAAGVGVFVRVLLPVTLTDDSHVTYGTWLALTNRDDVERARRLWHSEEYPSLVLEGVLANAIEPWGRPLMTRARVGVREPHEVPYVEAIHDADMARVISDVWPRPWVLSAIPSGASDGHRH